MTTKPILVPNADHPIAIKSNPKRVIVSFEGQIIADTVEALTLKEANYPAVQYIPIKDVEMTLLEHTRHGTYCPFKGDCSYYSIPAGGEKLKNAVWTYEAPYPAVGEIKEHLAFYTDRFDITAELPES